MNCSDIEYLIHAYIDGELDLIKSLEVETHIKKCSICSESYKNLQALQVAIGKLYYKPSEDFHKRIKKLSVQKVNEKNILKTIFSRHWIAIAASLLIFSLSSFTLAYFLSIRSANELLKQEIVTSHIHSLMVSHLTDVPSSDQHTVKPWFSGKLDFSPPVQDFSKEGFSIIGGRLDYINNRSVAAIVYQRHQHIINLFIWPNSTSNYENQRFEIHQGFNLIYWTKSGNNYFCISDLNKTELQELVNLLNQ